MAGSFLMTVAFTLLIASPPALAWFNHRMAWRFQKEVFGQWVTFARRFRFMVAMVFLYYLLVMVHGVVTGDIGDIFSPPLASSAWSLVGRIAVAIVVYVLTLGMGVAMQNVVRPQRQKTEENR